MYQGHKSKFIQTTFSILLLFYSTKKMSFSSFYFFTSSTKHMEVKLNIFYPLIFSLPFYLLSPNQSDPSFKVGHDFTR